jgi:uncharacterized protein YaaQ
MNKIGLSSTDALIKVAIELALEDLVKYPWIIDQMYSQFVENPILASRYGSKEIAAAKDFYKNNKITFLMKLRDDKVDFPCVTIAMGKSYEDKNLSTFADLSPEVIDYTPEEINKPINYVIPATDILSYDPLTGIMEIAEVDNYNYIGENMLAVDPLTGDAFVIIEKAGVQGFRIETGLTIGFTKVAIAPQFRTYRARMERIITQETYNIGCHVHGDQAQLSFLFNLVKYALLRYREGLFERFNFDLSTLSFSDSLENSAFGADNVYSRFITISGQVEEYWVKSPFRKWEVVDFIDKDETGGEAPGIKIISNKDDGDLENDVWTTIDDTEE